MQIKFLQSKISIAFRTRLTRYIHDLYLNDKQAYYKLQNLDGGLVGGGADQFITSDLPLFCDSAAALYSSLGKPFLDLVVFNYQLARSLGPLALAGILFNYGATAWMLKKFSPPFGRLAAAQGRKEGDFRGLHSKFGYRGHNWGFVLLTTLFSSTLNWQCRGGCILWWRGNGEGILRERFQGPETADGRHLQCMGINSCYHDFYSYPNFR